MRSTSVYMSVSLCICVYMPVCLCLSVHVCCVCMFCVCARVRVFHAHAYACIQAHTHAHTHTTCVCIHERDRVYMSHVQLQNLQDCDTVKIVILYCLPLQPQCVVDLTSSSVKERTLVYQTTGCVMVRKIVMMDQMNETAVSE